MSLRYVGRLSELEGRAQLHRGLARADAFRVHVPDGDGPLSEGRPEFLALPGVEVGPWDGMRDAVEISGPLTEDARELFLRLRLWDFQLVRAGTVSLQVGDFEDLQVDDQSS
ncbi:hypothetical protein [Symbioplanes lichenis]|uniref:hypothetical protein n=1 Tax=Symbioplanes lichenis TaxID=1629072 RepID=UPI00273A28C0|nr:hypothetical protein [Actinoplanes lichenis]